MNMYRKNRREKVSYKYDCTITGKSFKLTEKAEKPGDLMSVEAYYQMHADKDDRPAVIKKKLGIGTTTATTTTESGETN